MGAAIDSLSTAVGMVRDAPILIGLVCAVFLGFIVVSLIGMFIPFGNLIANVAMVFVLAGILGTAFGALHKDGTASVDTFKEAVNENWKSIGGAYLIITGLYMVLSMTVGIALFVLLFGAAGTLEANPEQGLTGVVALFFVLIAVYALVVTAINITVQFYDVAIVIGDYSAMDSFRESAALLREAPLSVLGYTVLRGVISSVPYLIPLGVGAVLWQIEPMVGIAVGGLIALVLFPLLVTLTYAYHVAYYTARRPETLDGSFPPWHSEQSIPDRPQQQPPQGSRTQEWGA